MTLQDWLAAYGESHRNPTNIAIHLVCVPTIVFCVFGLADSVPTPFRLSWLIFAAGMVFYYRLSPVMALGMAIMCGAMLYAIELLKTHGVNVLMVSAVVFVVAWIGQFIGHRIEGKKPSFFRDLQFLLIGPAWTLSHLFKRLGWKF